MRVNVYAEEITDETELVVKQVGKKTFYGLRLFLDSPDALHHTASDDDRSAVTLWVRWTVSGGSATSPLRLLLQKFEKYLDQVDYDGGEAQS